jgi:hypothetical protein
LELPAVSFEVTRVDIERALNVFDFVGVGSKVGLEVGIQHLGRASELREAVQDELDDHEGGTVEAGAVGSDCTRGDLHSVGKEGILSFPETL